MYHVYQGVKRQCKDTKGLSDLGRALAGFPPIKVDIVETCTTFNFITNVPFAFVNYLYYIFTLKYFYALTF